MRTMPSSLLSYIELSGGHMDSKIYKFRLSTEKENDNYVRRYIERNGRINSEEIAELLYKGIVSLNEPSTGTVEAKIEDKLNRMESFLLELHKKITEIQNQLAIGGGSPLVYSRVVKEEPEKQKRKLFSGKKADTKEQVDVYKTQEVIVEDYKGLLDYMVRTNPETYVWQAVGVAVNHKIPADKIVALVEGKLEKEKIYQAIEIILKEKEQNTIKSDNDTITI